MDHRSWEIDANLFELTHTKWQTSAINNNETTQETMKVNEMRRVGANILFIR